MKNETSRRPVVLAVDDEPEVLSALVRLFRREPVTLRTATDPDEAIELIRREPVRILMTDQRMKGMTGTDLVALARAAAPGIACVLITAFPDPDVLDRCLREQIDGVLIKPCLDEQLRGVVRDFLGDAGTPRHIWAPEDRAIEIDCDCGTSRLLCRSLAVSILKPSPRKRRAMILLENVDRLSDSVARFLKELHRLLRVSGRTALVVDRTGLTVAFWSAIGEGHAVVGNGQSGAVLVRASR